MYEFSFETITFKHEIYVKHWFVKKRGTKDTKGTVKLINLKQTDNAMAKNEKTNKHLMTSILSIDCFLNSAFSIPCH